MGAKGKCVLRNLIKVLVAMVSAFVLLLIGLCVSLALMFDDVHGGVYAAIVLAAAVLLEITVIGMLWGVIRKKGFYIPLCIAMGLCVAACCGFCGYYAYIDGIATVGERTPLLAAYAPYAADSKAVTLREASELTIAEDMPVLDGATALYPIYSAFAKALYPQSVFADSVKANEVVTCSTTTGAYRNIVTGDADMIFAASPSAEQKQFAADNGVELVYTPIGKEAFVFFVNAKNPIENITVDEIQKIYSGETTDWVDLGVSGLGQIKAFQRDKGSGSQSTLEKLMNGKTLMTPPKEDVISGMGGIIERTADYKNFKNALGYTFRFYATEMVGNNQIKLLSVNGAAPSLENIENDTYPLASYFYAVTRKDADENTLKILEWIQGEQGQKVIEMTGYTPLK